MVHLVGRDCVRLVCTLWHRRPHLRAFRPRAGPASNVRIRVGDGTVAGRSLHVHFCFCTRVAWTPRKEPATFGRRARELGPTNRALKRHNLSRRLGGRHRKIGCCGVILTDVVRLGVQMPCTRTNQPYRQLQRLAATASAELELPITPRFASAGRCKGSTRISLRSLGCAANHLRGIETFAVPAEMASELRWMFHPIDQT
jgi:hypothetical protein